MSEETKPSSLADRITMPAATPAAAGATPSAPRWSDEVASPTAPGASEEGESSLAAAQLDGQVEPLNGSGLHDGQYDVEVKLSHIQNDETSPLYSISTFEELGM
jgi:ATP-dependent RNA helicase DDX19/DBP5